MSARRVLAGSAIALLMPASLLLTIQTGSAADVSVGDSATVPSVSARKKAKQRVKVEALPQIVHQGKRVARADAAKAAISATFKPRKKNRPVLLQVKKGKRWKKAGRTRLDRKGQAVFAARSSQGGKALTYRVKGLPFKGAKAVTSKPVSTAKWLSATWTEEFSGSALGADWSQRGTTYEESSLRMCSKSDPSAVNVGGGAARISVLKDPNRSDTCGAKVGGKVAGQYAYRLNGHIGTQNTAYFKYGFAAARMKMHKVRGQHSSFWLLPQSGNEPHSAGHEIDVIEYFGDKHPQGGLTSFLHWYNGTKLTKTGTWLKNSESFLKNRKDGWSKNYHVFSVEWTPKKYVFRIDGKETWRTSRKISTDPQYVVLSLLASDYEIPQMKDSQLPQHMYVDWVRFWQDPAHSVE